MQRILIIGANGQVGRELTSSCASLGDVIVSTRSSKNAQIDLKDSDSIRSTIQELQPNIVINAAAYTAVDKAEEEIELAMLVNAVAPGVLAEEVKHINALLIHYSTDYVFDGTKGIPYTEKDQPNPINVYGKSKLEGDCAIDQVSANSIVLRTSWVYSTHGSNFMNTMLRLANEREELNVVDDQVGCPTSAKYIAEITKSILKHKLESKNNDLEDWESVYNLSTTTPTTWYEFAKQIIYNGRVRQLCNDIKIRPIPTSDYPTAAARPLYSVLSNDKLLYKLNLSEVSWKDDLESCFRGLC